MREDKETLSSLADDRDKLVLKKADLVVRHQESLRALRDANDGVIEARLRSIEAASDLAALKDRNVDIVQRLDEERRRVDGLVRQLADHMGKARAARDKAQEVLERAGQDGRDRLMDLAKDKTVEEIDEDIETEKAKLEVIQDADPGVLRDFEKRAREIAKLQSESTTRLADMDRLNGDIQALREEWEPDLDELIRKINDAFSYNFEQISCAGEVGVHKDEDFDKWAVEIKVKFRQVVLSLRANAHQLCANMLTRPLVFSYATERTKRSRSLTNTGSPVASVPSRRFSTSCLSSRWHSRHSAWWMRSTKVWTRATSAWFMSAWWRSRAESTLRSIS